jgi:hypothetical protein
MNAGSPSEALPQPSGADDSGVVFDGYLGKV